MDLLQIYKRGKGMGKNDEALGRYFADNKRYADLVNGFALNGRQVIKAEDLSPLDSRVHGKKNSKNSKYRDLIRRTAFGVNFAVIGVENQNEVHYAMPVRSMGYDVREYERQIAKRRRELRQENNISKPEFMSGLKKEDKLHPCITFVLYYGEDWDGSKDLKDMLDVSGIPEELLAVKKKEGGNMCQALKELLQDEWSEGKAEGVLLTLVELVRDGLLTLSVGAQRSGLSESEFEKLLVK